MTDPRLRWLNGSDGSWWCWRRVCWPVWAGGDLWWVNENGGNGGGSPEHDRSAPAVVGGLLGKERECVRRERL
ncbi:hypothetical protein M6B38_372050 [Iris pallida]|uniref:Uncharacterized protein n=1 Tax=Iris pallida TaxID=29817 RepID=A0AAX6GE41_IRIPA|nr:hypothetical protein M6B38_372050 [Iris pallida]